MKRLNFIAAVFVVLACCGLSIGSYYQWTYGQFVQGSAANGTSASVGYPVMVSGSDGTNQRTLNTDTSGKLQIGGTVSTSGTTTVSGAVTVSSGSIAVTSVPASPNPCQALQIQSAPFAITTATTTQLVAPNGSLKTTICGFTVSMIGTVLADTFQLEYGSGSSCGTGTTAVTGVMSSGILTAGATVISDNTPAGSSAASQGACAVTTVGTGPSIAGIVHFVQG